MATTRIYYVSGADKPRLVQASSQAQAVNHVVKGQYKAKVATQTEIVNFMLANDRAMVEKASEEE